MRAAAVVEVADADAPVLVTHAGLTQGFWRHYLGMPPTAEATAAALDRLVGTVHQSWLFRPGVMVTDTVDMAAGPLWASAPDELIPSWRETALPAPFDQVHGHSSLLDWTTGRRYGDPVRVGQFIHGRGAAPHHVDGRRASHRRHRPEPRPAAGADLGSAGVRTGPRGARRTWHRAGRRRSTRS